MLGIFFSRVKTVFLQVGAHLLDYIAPPPPPTFFHSSYEKDTLGITWYYVCLVVYQQRGEMTIQPHRKKLHSIQSTGTRKIVLDLLRDAQAVKMGPKYTREKLELQKWGMGPRLGPVFNASTCFGPMDMFILTIHFIMEVPITHCHHHILYRYIISTLK